MGKNIFKQKSNIAQGNDQIINISHYMKGKASLLYKTYQKGQKRS